LTGPNWTAEQSGALVKKYPLFWSKLSVILVKIFFYFGQNYPLFWSKLFFILVKIILYFGQNYPLSLQFHDGKKLQ
jgi:hypothetical protein